MEAPVLDGFTLGEKHQHFNKLVNEAITNPNILMKHGNINANENDVDVLIKIDIANHHKDLQFILEMLKSEDSLYVSRAIKKSTWLVSDNHYSHIINPEYLQSELFPQMTSKAINQLIKHIRLNLKDEHKAEDFYKYERDKNPETALRWLPICSVPFIENVLRNKENFKFRCIPPKLLARLCKRSFSIFEIYIGEYSTYNWNGMQCTKFLLYSHTKKYLDVISKQSIYTIPAFGKKGTEIVMKKCPEIILENFEKYAGCVDWKIFPKFLKTDQIKCFIQKLSNNEELHRFLSFNYLSNIFEKMPKKERFNFIKRVIIEKQTKMENEDFNYTSLAGICNRESSIRMYNWYTFIPFDVAFIELTKVVRAMSAPFDRISVLTILLTCAGQNMQHIQILLNYFLKRHINEPMKFKIQFINTLLSKKMYHKFDAKTWNMLEQIFRSMEVYAESTNNVQLCIQSILIYRVIHDEPIADIIEKKFEIATIKSIIHKLNQQEKDKLFNYLYEHIFKKIQELNISRETDLTEAIQMTEKVMNLLIEFDKDLIDCPSLITKIKDLIIIKTTNSWTICMSSLYNKKKSWKKYLFQESVIIFPSDGVFINALKHNPEIITLYKNEIDMIVCNDNITLSNFLSKLRIYWPQSLAEEWRNIYLYHLDKSYGHRALTKGLSILLTKKSLLKLLESYKPVECEINWENDNSDNIILSIRKSFAQNMYRARPLIPLETVLSYAQGSYLQYAVPSLNSVLYNLSCARGREHVSRLLNTPVSLQKYGIHFAFNKLHNKELKPIFHELWNTTTNTTIRTTLFKHTYYSLCREKNHLLSKEIWELLSMFIDNLSDDHNKAIYEILLKINKLPDHVKADFYEKSYTYLISLPAKNNCEDIINELIVEAPNIIDSLNPKFVTGVLLKSVTEIFNRKNNSRNSILFDALSAYLICNVSEIVQLEKCESILFIILDKVLSTWDEITDGTYCVKHNFELLLKQLTLDFNRFVVEKRSVIPVRMFKYIFDKLEKSLPIEENYVTITEWKLTIAYVTLVDEHKTILNSKLCAIDTKVTTSVKEKIWNDINVLIIPLFGKVCQKYLKDDVKKLSPSIYLLFGDALTIFWDKLFPKLNDRIKFLKYVLNEDLPESYLLVYQLLPEYVYESEEKDKVLEIRKMLVSHPSKVLKIHYYRKFGCTPHTDIDLK